MAKYGILEKTLLVEPTFSFLSPWMIVETIHLFLNIGGCLFFKFEALEHGRAMLLVVPYKRSYHVFNHFPIER